jgi:hypothetical protein
MSIADGAKGRAYWEWLRTANPWLPPFHRLSTACFNLNISTRDLEMKVVVDWPAEPFRFGPWEEALAREGCTELSWDSHLASALSALGGALEGRKEGFAFQAHLVRTAAHIRAMAPEGTKWEEPALLVPGGDRPRLRSVVKSLLEADEGHSACFRNEGSVTYHLVSAEASLHALWLASVEG